MTKRFLMATCGFLLAILLILLVPVVVLEPVMELRPTKPTTATPTTPPATVPTTSTGGTSMEPTDESTHPTPPPTTVPTPPITTTPTVPTQPAQPTVPPTTLPPRAGQVRLYTCDKDRLEKYLLLAEEYFAATGVEVILQTPAEGENCHDALARYMASEAPPTMFCIHREQTLLQYADQLYDLTNTQAAAQLYSAGFGMYYGEKLLALPVEVDWFGFIYNAKMLADAGFSRVDFHRTDMTGYHSISYIAETLRSKQVMPFEKPDFANAAILSALFPEADQLRSFVDLYVGNSNSGDNAMLAFQYGKNVFYAGTTADFEAALTLGIENLDLLPAFADGSNTMRYTCRSFLAVNGAAYEPDVRVTAVFLRWLVSGRADGGAPMDALGGRSPYKASTVSGNGLEKLLRKYMAEEPAQVMWDQSPVEPVELADFRDALAAYFAKPSDDAWEKVARLMKKKET